MASHDPVLYQHFKGHSNTVLGLTYNPKDSRLLSCSADKSVMLWVRSFFSLFLLYSVYSDNNTSFALTHRTRSPSVPSNSIATSARLMTFAGQPREISSRPRPPMDPFGFGLQKSPDPQPSSKHTLPVYDQSTWTFLANSFWPHPTISQLNFGGWRTKNSSERSPDIETLFDVLDSVRTMRN